MAQPLHVLIVEDNPADAELVVRELRRAGFAPEWDRVDTEAEYLARLRPDVEVILSDYHMPHFSGDLALTLLRQSGLEIPFIIVSGAIGEETTVAAMKQGATDYLLKDRLAVWGRRSEMHSIKAGSGANARPRRPPSPRPRPSATRRKSESVKSMRTSNAASPNAPRNWRAPETAPRVRIGSRVSFWPTCRTSCAPR
jgi:CheY-like chemotaxis protein